MNTQTVTTTAEIIAAIKDMSSENIMSLNNVFCESAHYYDDKIYYNDEETLSMLFGDKVLRAIQATQFGDYRYNDKFIQFDGYANLKSFMYLDQNTLPDTVKNIADYIMENQQDFTAFFEFE